MPRYRVTYGGTIGVDAETDELAALEAYAFSADNILAPNVTNAIRALCHQNNVHPENDDTYFVTRLRKSDTLRVKLNGGSVVLT